MFGALLIAGLVMLVRPNAVSSYALAHGAFVIGASAIGACAIAIAAGITLAVTALAYAFTSVVLGAQSGKHSDCDLGGDLPQRALSV
jgi:hypothetical protein